MSLGEGFGMADAVLGTVTVPTATLRQDLDPVYAEHLIRSRPLEPYTGDQITPGYVLVSNGLRFFEPHTITQILGVWDVPPNGTDTWGLDYLPQGDPTKITTAANVSGSAYSRVTPWQTLNLSVTAGDVISPSHAGGGTATFLGQGFRMIIILDGNNPIVIPGAITGVPDFKALYNSGSAASTLQIAAAVPSAYSYLLWKNGTFLEETRFLSASLASSASDTFQVQAVAPFASGPMSPIIPASLEWSGFGSASGMPPAGFGSPVLGSSTAPAPAITLTNGDLHMTSGQAGGYSNNDACGIQWNYSSSTYQLTDVRAKVAFDSHNSVLDFNMSADALASSFATTHLVQMEIADYGLRGGYKSTSGTGANSFQTVLPSSPWPGFGQAAYDGATLYGVRMSIQNPGDGSRLVNIYGGTAAALDAGTLPKWGSFSIPSAAVAGLAAGYFWLKLNGGPTAATAYGVHVQQLTLDYAATAGV